ncbi:hypothetical protein N9N67_03170 [Bacteriovoracaceae bacterium]|nr:hypothetical protein [Bacteriovoracaceae bacterium]
MKTILFSLFILTNILYANNKNEIITDTLKLEQSQPWRFEASITAQAIENANSPSAGASSLYHLSDRWDLGLRATTTLSGNEFEVGHTLQLLQRYTFYKSKTDLFVEFNQGYAEDKFDNYSLFGSSIGLTHQFTKLISFGGLAGLDKVQNIGGFSPKISAFIAVDL